jgi:signal transduction histidine kinase
MTAWLWPRRWREARSRRRSSYAMPPSRRLRTEWTPWAYALVCVPLILLLVEVLRGAVHETRVLGTQTLQSEVHHQHSQAMRRARGLEVLMEAHAGAEKPWAELQKESWLTNYWSRIQLAGSHQLYAAVVDETGNIVMHTDSARIGHRLPTGWYDRRVAEAGPNVVRTDDSALGNKPVYDITLPLEVAGQSLGEYHEGIDGRWLDADIGARKQSALNRWLVVLALMGVLDAAAVGGLVYVARRQSRLGRILRGEWRQRARELSQLGSGLAHEIRNPLHALRINLHTLRRAFGGRSPLGEDQLVATIDESNAAIDRLDGLMRDLLQFSDPSAGEVAQVDVVHEVRATLNLLGEELRREKIDVQSQMAGETLPVMFDPTRFRQLLLNLLTFAQHRAGKNGKIDVTVAPCRGGVEITVGDSGPPIPEEQHDRVFEPFQAPAETGSGLGLALVQVQVEEAGGCASWDGTTPSSSRCRLWLPLAKSGDKGGQE